MIKYLLALSFAVSAFGAIRPHHIPRSASRLLHDQGTFEGGGDIRADLQNIRLNLFPESDSEQWVLDFSDEKGKPIPTIPRFQLRYEKAESVLGSEGIQTKVRPARFILILRAIRQSRIHSTHLTSLIRKSRYVSGVVLYPQIENGDMGVEFTLRGNLLFELHQPAQRGNRLVLDLHPLALKDSSPLALSPPKPSSQQARSPKVRVRPLPR